MPFISKLLNKSIILLINLSHTLSFSLSHTHILKHTPFYTWYIFSCNFCMEGLWLNPNLIFQICSASIFMQPLRQEMILRWGLIWMEDIDSGQMCPYGWRKLRHKCATALQLMWSWDSWTGEQGEATQHFSQYKHKNMIAWEKKLKTLILNADHYRNSAWAIFRNGSHTANVSPIKSPTVITFTCWS